MKQEDFFKNKEIEKEQNKSNKQKEKEDDKPTNKKSPKVRHLGLY